MLVRALALLASSLGVAAWAVPQLAPDGMSLLMSGRYLEGIERLREDASRGDASARGFLAQFEPTITGIPRREVGGPLPTIDSETREFIDRAELDDAVREIVARARSTRIVILNEAHDTPRHRSFALAVARALRRVGYAHLAVETFSTRPGTLQQLRQDRYPRLSSGTYTFDPVFGDFIRQALRMGYQPVIYEEEGRGAEGSPERRISVREETQAENLATQLAQAGPSAKFFIYVGYGHVAEEPIGPAGRTATLWMAARLKAKTGVDPLTVDQTTLDEFGEAPASRAVYARLEPRLGSRSAVLTNAGRPVVIGPYRGAVDLQVVHPPMRLVGGRPSWLLDMRRRPVAIPRPLLPTAGHRLIQAFIAEEGPGAIPVDQVVVSAESPAPVMMLPRRPIRFATQDPALASR